MGGMEEGRTIRVQLRGCFMVPIQARTGDGSGPRIVPGT